MRLWQAKRRNKVAMMLTWMFLRLVYCKNLRRTTKILIMRAALLEVGEIMMKMTMINIKVTG